MIKKIIILILIIIIISTIIFLTWQNFVKNKIKNKNSFDKYSNEFSFEKEFSKEKEEESKEKNLKNKIINKITEDQEIFDFWFYQNQLFYLTKAGKVYKFENNNFKKIPYDLENKSPIKIIENKEKILAAFNNPLEPEWFIFDILDLIWRPLPNILEANWLNENEIIAIDKFERLIKINKNFETIIILNNFNFVDFYIHPLNSEEIILIEKPSEELENKIFIFNLKNLTIKPFKKIAKDVLIKTINKNLILRYSLDKNLIIDLQNKTEKIVLNTFIEKCAYNIKNNENEIEFYCFLPQKLISFNNYYQEKINTIDDTIIKIILKENEKFEQKTYYFYLNNEEIKDIKFDIKNAKYLNNKIYFINNYDNSIYEIDIEKLNFEEHFEYEEKSYSDYSEFEY